MKKRKFLVRITLVLLLIMAVASFYVYKEYNRTHKDTSELKADYSIAVTDLLKEFETSESDANKKYWDKVLMVDGFVKDLTKDDRGVFSIILGDTASMASVRCSMDSLHNAEAGNVRQGAHIAMKGICSGFNSDELLGSDVILVRCIVHSKK